MKRFICYYDCDYGTKEIYLICDNDEQMMDYMQNGLYDFCSDYVSNAYDYWYDMCFDDDNDNGDSYEIFLESDEYTELFENAYFEYYRFEDDKIHSEGLAGFFTEDEWKPEKAIDIREVK